MISVMIGDDRDGAEFLTGKLLVAMPGIGDPRFERAVLLICLHSEDHAMGVRINAPLAEATIDSVFEGLRIKGAPRRPGQLVLEGGPVDTDHGYVLHTADWGSPGSTLEIDETLSLTATRDALEAMTAGRDRPVQAMLALGYAGWGPGQLETEMRESVWLICPADPDLIFDDDHETKWERALRSIGVEPHRLSGEVGEA